MRRRPCETPFYKTEKLSTTEGTEDTEKKEQSGNYIAAESRSHMGRGLFVGAAFSRDRDLVNNQMPAE